MYCHNALFSGLLAVSITIPGVSSHNASAIYPALYSANSDLTPVSNGVFNYTADSLVRRDSQESLNLLRSEELIGAFAPGTPCANGACCSNTGICGYSPDECGESTCISNCDATAECGRYAPPEFSTCPLNACCSEHGFCGITEDFCDTGCQDGYGTCRPPAESSCNGPDEIVRTVGYYDGWASMRSCDRRLPSDIDVVSFTHINFAHAYFHPKTFQITPMRAGDEALYRQFTALRAKKPSLRTWISIGGWAFNEPTNEPNTQTAFSNMVSSAVNRRLFTTSLLNFMQTFAFDGVDIDWEMTVVELSPTVADTANFVELLKDLKESFAGKYGLSVTLPASYWYLRWFDLPEMQQYVDFFNVMTIDIHGVWDSPKSAGPYVQAHTNLNEAKRVLDLLRRNGIDPQRVNLGLGWYGRSFTLADPNCSKPGCLFSYGGSPGECTRSRGTLSNAEIQRIIQKNKPIKTLDAETAIKWISFDKDQWVSYDDGETIQMKISAANKLGLGGVAIWTIDQDSADHASSNNLLGTGTANGVSPEDAEKFREARAETQRAISPAMSCFWSACRDHYPIGYISDTYSKGQATRFDRDASYRGDDVRTLCCLPGTKTGNCSWYGWRGVGFPCASYCPPSSDMVAFNTNSYAADPDLGVDRNLTCNGGFQYYCCSGFVASPHVFRDEMYTQ